MEADENAFLARVSNSIGRFDDMMMFFDKAMEAKNYICTEEDMYFLSFGFKNQIIAARDSIRSIITIEEHSKNFKYLEALRKYRSTIEQDLYHVCVRILNSIRTKYIRNDDTDENKAFFYKMCADYCRYITECCPKSSLDTFKTDASDAYRLALEHSKTLHRCHPIRLGILLNLSVFYYQILNDRQIALDILQKALLLSTEDNVEDDDSKTILRRIEENVKFWKEEVEDKKKMNDGCLMEFNSASLDEPLFTKKIKSTG